MKISPHAASAAIAAAAKSNELNPAKQAKAADPAVKGAEFGHLVASFARAKHAPAPPLSPPVIEEPPAAETPPATEPPAETPPPADPAPNAEVQSLAGLIANTEPGDALDISA